MAEPDRDARSEARPEAHSPQERYERAVALIDAANDADPTVVATDGGPVALALHQGRRATDWVHRLSAPAAAPEPVLLAARAHHLRRFDVPRTSYPDGRAGYLRWRRDQKERHAADVCGLLAAAGYPDAIAARVADLVRRRGLGTDPEVQLVEDAACLVFLETQWDGLVARLAPDTLRDVVRKTVAKMSPEAVTHGAALRPEVLSYL